MVFMSLAERIRKARLSAGLTQPDLGAAIGVTKGAVSNWENGRDSPTHKHLKQIGGACSVNLAWLHDDQGHIPLTTQQRKALEILASLDDKSRASWFQVGYVLSERPNTPDTPQKARISR